MKCNRDTILLTLALGLVPLFASAEQPVIAEFGNGTITWEDTSTTGVYHVQWASSLTGQWHSSWSDLLSIWSTGGVCVAEVPMFYRVLHNPRQTNGMMLVAAGGQPQGPAYDFYVSQYEVRNEEFAEFLNNAELNVSNALGSNMYFSASGNVYMDNGQSSSEILFEIGLTRLLYNTNSPLGSRFTVYADYIGHPIVGVSWYGAVKYCNWLTLKAGRAESARCYSEGTNPTNWHPSNVSYDQWYDGFDDLERLDWVQNYAGFRLPMDDYTQYANYYNEFYKCAAWSGASNCWFGFGRSSINGQDANYSSSGDPFSSFWLPTSPVGYYDGTDHAGAFQTRSNANFFGLFDLSGNAAEWLSDMSAAYSVQAVYRGGAWGWGSSETQSGWLRSAAQKYTCHQCIGFRVLTTAP